MSQKLYAPFVLFVATILVFVSGWTYKRRPIPAKTFGAQITSSVHLKHLQTPCVIPESFLSNSSRYAIARLFDSFGRNLSYKLNVEIANRVNATGDGSNTDDIAEYLESFFHVKESHSTSFEKLAAHLDRGYPVIVTVQDGTKLHTAILSGYYKSNDRFTHWQICDSGLLEGKQTHEEFATRWSCHGFFGHQNHCLLLTPKGIRKWQKKWSVDEANPKGKLTRTEHPRADYLKLHFSPHPPATTPSPSSDGRKQELLTAGQFILIGIGVTLCFRDCVTIRKAKSRP